MFVGYTGTEMCFLVRSLGMCNKLAQSNIKCMCLLNLFNSILITEQGARYLYDALLTVLTACLVKWLVMKYLEIFAIPMLTAVFRTIYVHKITLSHLYSGGRATSVSTVVYQLNARCKYAACLLNDA